jgi:hypothetical protein
VELSVVGDATRIRRMTLDAVLSAEES